MIPVNCSTKHQPPNTRGDCLKACVASVLNLPSKDVPHFYETTDDPHVALEHLGRFLDELDPAVAHVLIPLPDNVELEAALAGTALNMNGNHYILFGEGHCVVCKGDQIVHDPSWFRTRLQKPETGYVVMLLVMK